MPVSINKNSSRISESELTEFENELDKPLPADYRAFLLAYNGGVPTPSLFNVDIDGFKNTSAVSQLLGLSTSEEQSLRNYLRIYKNRLPSNLLPIATELSVDLVCISLSGSDYGSVYFWDHNWEVTEREPDYENVHFLADSFTAFLNALYEDA